MATEPTVSMITRKWENECLLMLCLYTTYEQYCCDAKVFQCLLIDGENAGEKAMRDAERFVISDDQFETFIDRHRPVACLVPESNTAMIYSYLILDEYVSTRAEWAVWLPGTCHVGRLVRRPGGSAT